MQGRGDREKEGMAWSAEGGRSRSIQEELATFDTVGDLQLRSGDFMPSLYYSLPSLFSLFPTCLSSQWLQVAQSIKISSPMMSPTPRQRPRRRSWSKTAGSVIWIGTPSTSLLISSSPVRLLCPSSPTDLSPRSIVNQLRPLSKLTQRCRPLTVRPPDPPIPDTS
jgi:hypothetical protein